MWLFDDYVPHINWQKNPQRGRLTFCALGILHSNRSHFLISFYRFSSCFIIFSACVCVWVAPGAYLGRCTGRHKPSWRCTGVNWSGRADRGIRIHCHEGSQDEAAGPPLHLEPLTRWPSEICPESWRYSSPATRLAPWCRNDHLTHQHCLYDV